MSLPTAAARQVFTIIPIAEFTVLAVVLGIGRQETQVWQKARLMGLLFDPIRRESCGKRLRFPLLKDSKLKYQTVQGCREKISQSSSTKFQGPTMEDDLQYKKSHHSRHIPQHRCSSRSYPKLSPRSSIAIRLRSHGIGQTHACAFPANS